MQGTKRRCSNEFHFESNKRRKTLTKETEHDTISPDKVLPLLSVPSTPVSSLAIIPTLLFHTGVEENHIEEATNLFSIPSCIFEVICTYLDKRSLKNLRLVSRKARSWVPQSLVRCYLPLKKLREYIAKCRALTLEPSFYGTLYFGSIQNCLNLNPTFLPISENYSRNNSLGFSTYYLIPHGVEVHSMSFLFSDVADIQISTLPTMLKSLRFQGCHKISNEMIKFLPSSLQNLELISNSRITERNFKYLPKKLTSLNLTESHKRIVDKGISFLPRNLTHLNLSRTKILDEALKHLPPKLLYLELSMCKGITDEGIGYLPSTLQSLDLDECTSLTHASFSKLPNSLTSLSIVGCKITVKEELDKLPKTLLSLNLSNTEFSDNCLPFLPPKLTYLDVSHSRSLNAFSGGWGKELISLNMQDCFHIDFRTLKHLPTTLKDLNIAGCFYIHDESLSELEKLNLTELHLSFNKITDRGLRYLPNTLKKIFISWCDFISESAKLYLSRRMEVHYEEGTIWKNGFESKDDFLAVVGKFI